MCCRLNNDFDISVTRDECLGDSVQQLFSPPGKVCFELANYDNPTPDVSRNLTIKY